MFVSQFFDMKIGPLGFLLFFLRKSDFFEDFYYEEHIIENQSIAREKKGPPGGPVVKQGVARLPKRKLAFFSPPKFYHVKI